MDAQDPAFHNFEPAGHKPRGIVGSKKGTGTVNLRCVQKRVSRGGTKRFGQGGGKKEGEV